MNDRSHLFLFAAQLTRPTANLFRFATLAILLLVAIAVSPSHGWAQRHPSQYYAGEAGVPMKVTLGGMQLFYEELSQARQARDAARERYQKSVAMKAPKELLDKRRYLLRSAEKELKAIQDRITAVPDTVFYVYGDAWTGLHGNQWRQIAELLRNHASQQGDVWHVWLGDGQLRVETTPPEGPRYTSFGGQKGEESEVHIEDETGRSDTIRRQGDRDTPHYEEIPENHPWRGKAGAWILRQIRSGKSKGKHVYTYDTILDSELVFRDPYGGWVIIGYAARQLRPYDPIMEKGWQLKKVENPGVHENKKYSRIEHFRVPSSGSTVRKKTAR